MRGVAGIMLAIAAFLVVGSSPAPAARLLPVQRQALLAVKHASRARWIDPVTAANARREINRAAALVHRLPRSRSSGIEVALSQLAAFDGRLTRPRALALTGQLKANDNYFSRHWPPHDRTDIQDADGIDYRYFLGRCFEFHPLADFGKLNARVTANDPGGARRLADALIARGVHRLGGIGWEYYFPFGGGQAPWLSGMVQAVAAQAFTRAAALVPDKQSTYLTAARLAYRPIPAALLTRVSAGPWIREYAFDSTAVLNAQLQTVVSLKVYAAEAHDPQTNALVSRLQSSAAAMLPRFDTGYWTLYALPNDLSPLDYQDFVVRLLRLLAPADKRFADAAARFARYRHEPPAFRVDQGPLGTLRFWLSKPATLTATSAAGPTQRVSLGGGWHSFGWAEPKAAGVYPIKVNAVDWAGNRASFESLPIVRVGQGAGSGTATRTVAASTPPTRPPLYIGAGLDDPMQATRAQKLGFRLVRFSVDWPVGETTPDLALVAALRQLQGSRVLLELRTDPVPTDDSTRSALAEYAAALAQTVPGIHFLVVTPAPTVATATDYAAELAAVRDAVEAVSPDVAVGPLLDGGATPQSTLAALALTLPATDVDVFAFRPAAAGGSGWTIANLLQLTTAVKKAFGKLPPLLVDGLATPTTIPANQLALYPPGQQQDPAAVTAKAQGDAYAATISAAACSSELTGIVLDRLVDDSEQPAAPSGIAYASGDLKASAAAVMGAAGPTQRGTVVCPGLASRSGATDVEFPTELDAGTAPSVVLGCARDCLYLIALEDASGRPVSARRGALTGLGLPVKRELPKVKLSADAYRFDVRIVDRVNPGAVVRTTSALLPVSR